MDRFTVSETSQKPNLSGLSYSRRDSGYNHRRHHSTKLPIHADARSLPFAAEFFDAIVCIDSFLYYGTDDLYLS